MTATALDDEATAPASDSDLLSLRLWLQLMKCGKTVEAAAGGQLHREHRQSLARFDVLSQLHRLGGGWRTVGDVADAVMASSGNITSLLDRMAADGLVRRRANPADRRSHQVAMTDAGRDLFDRMAADHARWIGDALDGVSERDKKRLIELLVKVRRSVENAVSPETPRTAG